MELDEYSKGYEKGFKDGYDAGFEEAQNATPAQIQLFF